MKITGNAVAISFKPETPQEVEKLVAFEQQFGRYAGESSRDMKTLDSIEVSTARLLGAVLTWPDVKT
jgi:hypothetical protein